MQAETETETETVMDGEREVDNKEMIERDGRMVRER